MGTSLSQTSPTELVEPIPSTSQQPSTSQALNHLKPTKPDTFYAKRRESVEAWIFQVQQYFNLCQTPANLQVPFASSLLHDHAAIWWQNHIQQVLAGLETCIQVWQDFVRALQEQFRPINATKIARDKLAVLQQLTSVQDYSYQFQTLILEIPSMTEEEKIDKYI